MFVDWFKNVSAMFVYVYEIYATVHIVAFKIVPANNAAALQVLTFNDQNNKSIGVKYSCSIN